MKYVQWKMKRTIGAAFICLLILIAPAQGQTGPFTWHVSEHVVGGTGFGDTWANANPSLADALSTAQGGDTIKVGQGTYYPDSGQSFVINQTLNQLKLIGGYAGWLPNGTLAPYPDQRDVQANQTILSGDPAGDDGQFTGDLAYLRNPNFGDNSATVVRVQNVTQGTRIEGLFIEHGAGGVRGGGMFINDSQMDVVNCTFRYNVTGIPFVVPETQNSDPGTTSDGGGATVRGGQIVASVVQFTRFINCTFHDNIAARGGGLALVDESNTPTQVKVVNSLFYDNQALEITNQPLIPPDGSGGAILVYGVFDIDTSCFDVMVEVTNCTIANNNAQNTTGGFEGGRYRTGL